MLKLVINTKMNTRIKSNVNESKQHIIGVHMKGKPVYQCSQPNCGQVFSKTNQFVSTQPFRAFNAKAI